MFNPEYDYRPNIGRHEVLVRSSPYPYNVNILFNIFTLSQEKSTESFRFCNNCAVLLVRSSSAGKEYCFTISVDVHLLENIQHFSLQLPQKRDQKGTKVLRHFHKIAPFLHIVDICPLPLCIPTPSSQTNVAFETPCLSSAINNIDSGVGVFWR